MSESSNTQLYSSGNGDSPGGGPKNNAANSFSDISKFRFTGKLDSKLVDQALVTLKKLAKGNGLKAEDIKLERYQGGVLKFEAETILEFTPKVHEKTVNGRAQGEVLPNAPALHKAVQSSIMHLGQDGGAISHVVQSVLARKDSGIGLKNQIIPLKGFQRDFVVHEQCATCQGKVNQVCGVCRGKGALPCRICNAQGMITCSECRGSRVLRDSTGRNTQCYKCQGAGRIGCTYCQRRGQVPCKSCGGKGGTGCQACGATGWRSHCASIMFQAVGNFTVDPQTIPPRLHSLMIEQGQSIYQNGHMQVAPQTGNAGPAEDKSGVITIPYSITAPYGEVEVSIGQRVIPLKLFGYKARLLDVQPFLDSFVRPGINMLDEAVEGHGYSKDGLEKACRFRIVNEGILAASANPRGAAFKIMKKRYPHGLRKKTLQEVIFHADQLVRNATLKSRYLGLAAGMGVVAVLYALYYLGPLRGSVNDLTPNKWMQLGVDVALMGLGAFISTQGIKLMSKRALDDVLSVVKIKPKKPITPRTSKAGSLGIIGGIVIYFLIVELTLHVSSSATPWWYAAARSFIG